MPFLSLSPAIPKAQCLISPADTPGAPWKRALFLLWRSREGKNKIQPPKTSYMFVVRDTPESSGFEDRSGLVWHTFGVLLSVFRLLQVYQASQKWTVSLEVQLLVMLGAVWMWAALCTTVGWVARWNLCGKAAAGTALMAVVSGLLFSEKPLIAALKHTTAFPVPYPIVPRSRGSCWIDQHWCEWCAPKEASAKQIFRGWGGRTLPAPGTVCIAQQHCALCATSCKQSLLPRSVGFTEVISATIPPASRWFKCKRIHEKDLKYPGKRKRHFSGREMAMIRFISLEI